MDTKQQNKLAVIAMREGRIAEAEKMLVDLINQFHHDIIAKYNLCLLYLNSGRPKLAEPLIMDCAAASPSLEVAWTLVNVLEANQKINNAITVLEDILAAVPGDAQAHFRLGTLLASKKNKDATKHFKAAWQLKPSIKHGIHYVQSAFTQEPQAAEHVISSLLAQVPKEDPTRLEVFAGLLPYVEFARREAKGLPVHHGLSLKELFFPLSNDLFSEYLSSAERFAGQNNDKARVQMHFALASFCARNYEEMQKQLAKAGLTDGIWSITRMNNEFMKKLATADANEWYTKLPAAEYRHVTTLKDPNIIFCACDARYFFSFTLPMMRSLAAKSPNAQMHLHLFDPSENQTSLALSSMEEIGLRFSLSTEQTGHSGSIQNARNYYHSIRFIRLKTEIEKNPGKIFWLMDVDALFNRPAEELFDRIGAADIALRIRGGRLEPWNQFNASAVGFTDTNRSTNYLDMICNYIMYFYDLNKLHWGIDQLAMFAVFEYLKQLNLAPNLTFLDQKDLDLECTPSGKIWCNSGTEKFFMLNQTSKTDNEEMTETRHRFQSAFLKYFKRTDLDAIH